MSDDERPRLPAHGTPALPERRFRDDEVAAILARAASREAGTDLPAPHDPTLADLMAAAADAGLDPGEVRRAAALLPAVEGGLATVALGAPDRREARAVLDGVRIPTDTRLLVREAERAAGRRGEVVTSERGRFLWEERHLGGGTTVSLTEEEGVLEVHVSADRAGHYLGLWFGGLVGWAVLSALTPLGALPLLGQALAFALTPFVIARPFWVASDRKLRAGLERAVLDVSRAAEGGSEGAEPPGSAGGAALPPA